MNTAALLSFLSSYQKFNLQEHISMCYLTLLCTMKILEN